MSKVVKDMIIADLRQQIGDCRDMLIVDSSALDGVTQNNMRLKLHQQQIQMLAVKNALARKALGDMGLTGLESSLSGPSVLVWGGPDIVALSKEISKWAKNPKLVVKGGVVDGQAVNSKQVDAISKGPSREELIGKIAMLMLSPGAKLAGALLGPGGILTGQFKALGDKEPEAAPAEPEPAPAA